MSRIILFGGTGFIGTHLAQLLLESEARCEIVLADLNPPCNAGYAQSLQRGIAEGRVSFVPCDVRQPIDAARIGSANTVINLAAILREPGYEPHEYFETNLLGAQNVCDYASSVGASHLIFTSSVSIYGPTEEAKAEDSLPIPETPYGSSKLAAEYIHRAWQLAAPGRRLLILRPGVIFGPGENGNVTRLTRSLARGYFAYMGNRATRKAGGYVKELARVILFAVDYQIRSGEALTIVNFSSTPVASMQEFVDAIRGVLGVRRRPFSLPRWLLLGISYPIDALSKLLGIQQPICPTRMRKLFRSTNIEARRLQQIGYQFRYSLQEAFEDWKKDLPADFS